MAALEHNSFLFNADDFGMGSHISRGITLSVRQGIVTSISVCVNGVESAEDIRKGLMEVPGAQIGLHINLTEGERLRRAEDSLSLESKLEVEPIRNEILAQVELFRLIAGSVPTHIDCHQHFAYLSPKAFEALVSASVRLNIPIRSPAPFLDVGRLEKFIAGVESRFGISLPFRAPQRAKELLTVFQKYPVKTRTEDVCIDFDVEAEDHLAALQLYSRNNASTVEVVCHPRLVENQTTKSFEPSKETSRLIGIANRMGA